jgi:hypothetical protein
VDGRSRFIGFRENVQAWCPKKITYGAPDAQKGRKTRAHEARKDAVHACMYSFIGCYPRRAMQHRAQLRAGGKEPDINNPDEDRPG